MRETPPASSSPIRSGLRAAARRPRLLLAEFAWRVAFAFAALALLAAALVFFVEGLRFSEADVKALRSGLWLLVVNVLVRVLSETYPQLVRVAVVLAPTLAVLWMFIAAAGRAAVLRPLLALPGRPWLRALLGLHLLRVALGAAALLAFYGSVVFAWELAATPDGDRLPGIFLRALVSMSILVLLGWSLLAWFLWLASIAAVAGGSTFGAVAQAFRIWRRHLLHFLRAGLLFSLLRVLALAAAAGALFALFLQATPENRTVVGTLALLLLLGYVLLMSWLRVVRLATFTILAQEVEEQGSSPASPADRLGASAPEGGRAGL